MVVLRAETCWAINEYWINNKISGIKLVFSLYATIRRHFCNRPKEPLLASLRFLTLRTFLCVITAKSNYSEWKFSWFSSVLPTKCVCYDVNETRTWVRKLDSNSLTKTKNWSSRNEVIETSGRLHPLWPQDKWLHTLRTTYYRHSRLDRWIQKELVSSLAKNATKPNRFEIILLQTARKENNRKTEETLERAIVTLETERIKGSNPWCLWWWWWWWWWNQNPFTLDSSSFSHLYITCRFKTRTRGPVNPALYWMRWKHVFCPTKVIKRTEWCLRTK